MWLLAAGVILLLLIGEVYRSNHVLRVREEDISFDNLPDALDGLRIVHLTDLHNRAYGKHNATLAHFIRHQDPDFILCTGDMIENHTSGAKKFCDLLRALEGKYPLYFSLGNHELRLGEGGSPAEQVNQCAALGAVCLENQGVTLERRGQAFALYGYCSPIVWDGGKTGLLHSPMKRVGAGEVEQALGPKPPDVFTLLMAHDPDSVSAYKEWGADLTLSGHIHGGLWRPFGVGMLSPSRRLFPRYSSGLYRDGKTGRAMFVSTGLNSSLFPRLWNPPELAVLTLRSGHKGEEQ